MIPIYTDPDFTGFPPPAPNSYWQITRDQWYVITRVFMREFIRMHAVFDMPQLDPDGPELSWIANKVRAHVAQMRQDRTWSHIAWSQKISWSALACYANWIALTNNPKAPSYVTEIRWFEFQCPPEVSADYSYMSGLAAWGASLDTYQSYQDPINESRYESACDTAFFQAIGSYNLGEKQLATMSSEPMGTGYQSAPVDEAIKGTAGSIAVGATIGGFVAALAAHLLGAKTLGTVISGVAGAIAGGVAGEHAAG